MEQSTKIRAFGYSGLSALVLVFISMFIEDKDYAALMRKIAIIIIMILLLLGMANSIESFVQLRKDREKMLEDLKK